MPPNEKGYPEGFQRVPHVVRRHSLRIVVGVLAFVLGAADRAAAQDFLRNLFGSHMNDVAVRVAELPEKYRYLYSASLAFSPDGRLLADEAETAPEGEAVHIWDWRERRIVKTLVEPGRAQQSVELAALRAGLSRDVCG